MIAVSAPLAEPLQSYADRKPGIISIDNACVGM